MGLCPKPRKDLPVFDLANGLSMNLITTAIKRGREVPSVGILKGTCILKQVLGRAQYDFTLSLNSPSVEAPSYTIYHTFKI